MRIKRNQAEHSQQGKATCPFKKFHYLCILHKCTPQERAKLVCSPSGVPGLGRWVWIILKPVPVLILGTALPVHSHSNVYNKRYIQYFNFARMNESNHFSQCFLCSMFNRIFDGRPGENGPARIGDMNAVYNDDIVDRRHTFWFCILPYGRNFFS